MITFDPVNWWAGFLLLAAALDLNKSYVQARYDRQGPLKDCPSRQNS